MVTAWLAGRVAALGAAGGVVALVTADAAALEPRWWVGYPEEVIDSWVRIELERSTPLTDALRGDPVAVVSPRERDARYPALDTGPTTGLPGLAAVAIPGPGGRPVGALGFSFSAPFPSTVTVGVLLAAAQELAALLPAENDHDRAQSSLPDQHRDSDTAFGPASDLAVLN